MPPAGARADLALLVTPAAAAARLTASPVLLPVLSVAFALVAMEGGILLALGSTVPISPYVTTISFLIYLGCRLAGGRRGAQGGCGPGSARPGGLGGFTLRGRSVVPARCVRKELFMHPLAIAGATAGKLAHYAVSGVVGGLIIKNLPAAKPAARKALVGGLAGGIVASRWLASAAEEARLKAGDMLAEARTTLGEEVPPPSAVNVNHDDHGHEH